MWVLALPDSITAFQLSADSSLSLSLWLLKEGLLRGQWLTLTCLSPLIVEEPKGQQPPISNTYSYSIVDDVLMLLYCSKEGLFLWFGRVLDLSRYTENTRVLRIYSSGKTLEPKPTLLGGFHQPNLTKSQQLKDIPARQGCNTAD